MTTESTRRQRAHGVRLAAADLARDRVHPAHVANGDELRFRHGEQAPGRRAKVDPCEDVAGKPTYIVTYTKGLPHDYVTGLVCQPDDVQQFIRAIDSGDPRDFQDTPLGAPGNRVGPGCAQTDFSKVWKSRKAKTAGDGGKAVAVRAWESQGAGNTFDLEGPDAQAVTMPPAPALGSDELTAEMGEVYAQALLRDVPFSAFACQPSASKSELKKVADVLDKLNRLPWFAEDACCRPSLEQARARGPMTPQNAFRGITAGDDVGPYISQFLLAGNRGVNGNDDVHEVRDGQIAYGAVRINQRVRTARRGDDHMTTWSEWFDVQNGADLRGQESYVTASGDDGYRFITTPRDLATYVHYDALYEAYLNACLIMLGAGVPFDPGVPFQAADVRDHQQGFAHFGGPHILSLVTEVATRALKAVRFQKFNIHRRCRPEVLAARLEKVSLLKDSAPGLGKMHDDLGCSGLLALVKARNDALNRNHSPRADRGSYLLPMAFCEGSPMHPAYGAGHATVAGACVTILKAFFDHGHELSLAGSPGKAFIPDANGKYLEVIDVVAPKHDEPSECVPARLTVEGELNKLASNIAIGRDWAGVHYFTDYIESIRMGEAIAIGILEEQKLTYAENFSMTVPLFDGGTVRI